MLLTYDNVRQNAAHAAKCRAVVRKNAAVYETKEKAPAKNASARRNKP